MTTATHATLINTFWSKDNVAVRNVLLAIAGSIALWVSAKIQVPFYPVPVSMQTFAVLMIGMAFGWKLGGATVALYLFEGLAGLPVFAGTPEKGIGLAYMLGTTGGYLFGFLVAAVVVGWLAERGFGRNVFLTGFAMVIGTALIFAFGLLWLGSVVGWDKPVLEWGLYPFLAGAAFKITLAAVLMPTLWKMLGSKKD